LHRVLKSSARFVWRLGVLIVGMLLLIAGIIMIFTPGPAVVFIPLGLGVLATEFQWARRLLHRIRPLIEAAIEKAIEKKQAAARRRAERKARSNPPQPTSSPVAAAQAADPGPSLDEQRWDSEGPVRTLSRSTNR
jgi:uncharacterized protein (TIGR02611 family)